jgi:ADP-heptose:LPS heptosyltransferase
VTSGAGHVLVARLDSLGDMIVCGPAIRAVAARAERVTVLAGPEGAAAARLLPGVDEVITYDCPWIRADPAGVDRAAFGAIMQELARQSIDQALILTSFHQSALPTALLLRLAGVRRISAVSEDYPGALLDARIPPPPDAPEPVRMSSIADAAGFPRPPGDDGRLAVRLPSAPPPHVPEALESRPFVVLHPGATAAARTYPVHRWRELAGLLAQRGERVVVTGSRSEAALVAEVCSGHPAANVLDLAGALTLTELAHVLRIADAVVVANTGPAHLAAAVGTPVVSLFAPVVPAARWAPYGAHVVVLGDQHAACRDTRARVCPIAGHPCLTGVSAAQVMRALDQLRPHTRTIGGSPAVSVDAVVPA